MSYLFFTSYARADTKYASNDELVRKFISDLAATVDGEVAPPVQNVCFFDRTDIEAGTSWSSELGEALRTSRVAVPLYSPGYFASQWCGREFQVFLDRAARLGPNVNRTRPIVPVLWIKTPLPFAAKGIQHDDALFPAEYVELGMRALMKVSRYKDAYEEAILAIAKRIIGAVSSQDLPEVGALDLTNPPSAWDQTTDDYSHKSGSISKTCFVFVAQKGWHWQPYPSAKTIGALAQQVSGELGLQYEEIPCDAGLIQKLHDTHESNVPTVLFGDPASLASPSFSKVMRDYDTLYLLNCGTLLPWDSTISADERLAEFRRTIFRQKIVNPPPNHEWRSIFSQDDLRARTIDTIERIRQRLLQAILASDGDTHVLRAHDQRRVDEAAQMGLRLDAAPQVTSPSTPAS